MARNVMKYKRKQKTEKTYGPHSNHAISAKSIMWQLSGISGLIFILS